MSFIDWLDSSIVEIIWLATLGIIGTTSMIFDLLLLLFIWLANYSWSDIFSSSPSYLESPKMASTTSVNLVTLDNLDEVWPRWDPADSNHLYALVDMGR